MNEGVGELCEQTKLRDLCLHAAIKTIQNSVTVKMAAPQFVFLIRDY
jgi:hypothetical protein